VAPRLLYIARVALPARPHVVIHGYPATEGNAVRLVAALLDRSPRDIFWFDAPSMRYLESQGIDFLDPRLHFVRTRSLRAVMVYLTARFVFFTHGLFGEPSVRRGKTVVNLWHGAGIKDGDGLFPFRTMRGAPSTYVAAATELWGARTAQLCGLTGSSVLASGYPRNDDLFRPATRAQLAQLGIAHERPFVVWMPTYRRAVFVVGGVAAEILNTTDTGTDLALADFMAPVAEALLAMGVQVVVKPHPMDISARSLKGAIVVENKMLEDAGLSLYSLLGASAGLVSDTSSVWVDYLLLDRPIGFLIPDAAALRDARGIYPDDAFDWLPGVSLHTSADTHNFVNEVALGTPSTASLRQAAVLRSGMVQTETAANDLLDQLSRRDGEAV
jgi:CDP-glycerol glycerophosphotransferase (TagB/SpsB family)